MNGTCLTYSNVPPYAGVWATEDKDSMSLMGKTNEGVEFCWMKISKELLKKPAPFVATEIVKDGK